MDVKEAARTAKDYLLDLFEGEEIMNVGLEEIDFDDSSKSWSVTVGFWRPWDYSNKSPMTPTLFGELSQPLTRSFKIVRINDQSGRVLAVKDRMLTHST